jgi:hypothetical protein
MNFENGEFIHYCAFKACAKQFSGRRNRKYCSEACKNAANNLKSASVNQACRELDKKLRKANRILINIFKPNAEGWFRIKSTDLAYFGFPFDLPTNRIKEDNCAKELFVFGLFGFYKQENYFIFRKLY